MNVRPSKVLEKLRAGKVANATKVNSSDPRLVELVGLMGFDCCWLDMEHVGNSYTTIENQIYAAKSQNIDSVVRTTRGCYSNHVRPLEMDASGIMVPHVMNLEDAKQVVRMSKFYPIGRRPVDSGNSDGKYCLVDFNDYLEQSNREKFVIIQIEDPEPMNELDEICALEGIDIVFFGPGDFSQGIGDPGNFENPELLRAQKLVAQTAIKHGKFAGTVSTPANMAQLIDMGYRFLSCGADVIGLENYYREIVSSFKKNQL